MWSLEVKPTIVSAIGAVLKADSEEVRLIYDCSQPEGSAVNDYADIIASGMKPLMMPLSFSSLATIWPS